jgi:hypothetical protein
VAIDAQKRIRNNNRRWTIKCKNGSYQTLSLTATDAERVARWCDQYHPDCKPHLVLEKETNGPALRSL